jgi:hypothetical protein
MQSLIIVRFHPLVFNYFQGNCGQTALGIKYELLLKACFFLRHVLFGYVLNAPKNTCKSSCNVFVSVIRV